jgi:hypothetical protein
VRGAQNARVLACSMPRKPAPLLALRGAMATTRVRPTAFGNALGQSIADGMQNTALPSTSGPAGALSLGGGLLAAQAGLLASDPDQFRADQLARIQRQLDEMPVDSATEFRVEISGVATADEYNAAQVQRAFERGDDLAPTLANAKRLELAPLGALSEQEKMGMIIAAQSAGDVGILGIVSGMPGDIASGQGGLSGEIGNPLGRAIGAGGSFMHEYKYGALESIAIDTELAARRGDSWGLYGNALKGELIQDFLPGSPQEASLMVGGGLVAGDGLKLVAGAAVKQWPVLGMSVGDAWSDLFAAAGSRVGSRPIGDAMLPDGEWFTNKPPGYNELANQLRQTGPTKWESPEGLEYGPDLQYGNRVQHVLRHALDQPTRVGEHGVFDAGPDGFVQVVDEAWVAAQQGGSNVVKTTVGNKDTYLVDMGRRVGWVGGQGGATLGNPAVNNIQLVVRNGNQVVTAYPIR